MFSLHSFPKCPVQPDSGYPKWADVGTRPASSHTPPSPRADITNRSNTGLRQASPINGQPTDSPDPGQAQAGPLQEEQLRNSKNTKSRNAQQWKMVQKYIHLKKYSSGTMTHVFEACNIHKLSMLLR